jgi:hypothetical protein
MISSFVIASRRATPLLGALALLGLAVSGVLPGSAEALAHLLPAVLLLFALVARRYPGERVLLAAIERGRRQRRRRGAGSLVGVARARMTVPRGGLLLAFALAVRPPPAPRVALS